MIRMTSMTIAAALLFATTAGAHALTKKQMRVSAEAARSLNSTTLPSEPASGDPNYFIQAKGNID